MSSSIAPYRISIPEARLVELQDKLRAARFPDELDDAGWDMGSPLADIRRLTAFWRDNFDWRTVEKKLNELPHYTTSIQAEGYEPLQIHFLHCKSDVKDAVPLLFAHGWPGSFLEATKMIAPLTAGTSNGGVAFHVVVPSLPGYGFSEGSKKRGFAIDQHAEICHKLMLRLGYDQYVTQGGDWGWGVTRAMSLFYPQHCKATHLNMDHGVKPSFLKHPLLAIEDAWHPYTAREKQGFARTQWFAQEGFGYNLLHRTKPQTIGYALTDSPVALLSWIYEKLHDWSDNYPWTPDEVCTWISIYWFSTAGPAESIRLYYATGRSGPWGERLTRDRLIECQPRATIGLSHFPRDIEVLPSTWTRTLGACVFEKEHAKGGHFAAWECPAELVADLREMFGPGGGAHGVVVTPEKPAT